MPSSWKTAKSSEKILDSSSDEDDPQIPSATLLQRSLSPSSSIASSSSPPSSPALSSKSPSRSPSPSPLDSSQYQYQPPSSYEVSSSKGKSVMSNLRSGEEIFFIRMACGVSLEDAQFNLRQRKVRIGEEEWELLEEDGNDIRVIRPRENTEKFELGDTKVSVGYNLARKVKIPKFTKVAESGVVDSEKKRKREEETVEESPRKTPSKHRSHKDKHDKEEKHHKDKHHKHRDKDKDHRTEKEKEKSKEKKKHDKDGHRKEKSEKHKHRNS